MSTLHVSKYGPKYNQVGDAPILVLLHGWGSSSKVWQPCVEKLAEEFQVWCIDLPGHGESHGIAWDESVTHGVQLLAEILPERSYMVGWSLGGLYAQLFAIQHPRRVISLMLVASTPKFVASSDWPYAMPNHKFVKFAQQFNVSPTVTLKQFRALQALHSVSSKEVMRVLKQSASTQYPQRISWGLRWLQELDLRHSCVVEDIPLQLLHGENDQVSPIKAVEQALETWKTCARLGYEKNLKPSHKNIQFCKIADAGHTPFLSHPKRFIQQVNMMLAQQNNARHAE